MPPAFAADAIMEAADAGIKVIVTITEGIPTKDMIAVKHYLKDRPGLTMIGPNCPGVMTAGECKVGIMPGFIFTKGRIGIVSKSGTLTYEAVDQLTKAGLGQTTAIGIGGDPIIGTTTKQAVELLMNDPETEGIVMIGEIGGGMEAEAARWIKETGNKKPVVGFIAGQTAPPGRRMGHAGAIVGGADDTAAAKMAIMRECGHPRRGFARRDWRHDAAGAGREIKPDPCWSNEKPRHLPGFFRVWLTADALPLLLPILIYHEPHRTVNRGNLPIARQRGSSGVPCPGRASCGGQAG